MENLSIKLNPDFNPEELKALGSSLGGGILETFYKGKTKEHYQQFSDEVVEWGLYNSSEKLLAKVTCFTKEFYEQDRGLVKVLIVTDIRTLDTREALVGWADLILPDILNFKKDSGADYALFYFSRKNKGFFDFFIRPRRVRKDQVRFSHLRRVSLQLIQGKKVFADPPLKHIQIRRAQKEDLVSLAGFIKRASLKMPLSRSLDQGNLMSEIEKWDGFDIEDVALAFDSQDKIVGSLGVYNLSERAEAFLDVDENVDPTFLALQSYLRLGSWLTDLRPVLSKPKQNISFFTHMYFNNCDVFYSLMNWWFKETKKERPLFFYPYFKGDLKSEPSDSLFSTAFNGDLYIIQEDSENAPKLLKPNLFAESIDIDLHLLI